MSDYLKITIRNEQPIGNAERVLLMPWGEITNTNGALFTVDAESARLIGEQLAENSVQIPFDYGHATEEPVGAVRPEDRKASGWIKSIEAVPGEGIYAMVQWTPAAAAHIANKEFLYVSPVVLVRQSDSKVVGLSSAALTNKPAIPNMPSLRNSQMDSISDSAWESLRNFVGLPVTASHEEILMQMEEFLKKARAELGLPDTADTATVLSEMQSRTAAQKALRTAVCNAAGVKPETADTELVACVAKLKLPTAAGEPDPTRYAPISAVTALRDEVATLRNQQRESGFGLFLSEQQQAGRIANAAIGEWKRRYMENPEQAARDVQLIPTNTFPAPGRVVKNSAAATTCNWDPAAQWNKLIAEKMVANTQLSRTAAAIAVNRENPGLRESYVDSINSDLGRAG